MTDKDDIFDDGFLDDVASEPMDKEIGSTHQECSVVDETKSEERDDIRMPKLIGDDYPDAYVDVVNRFLEIYQTLPKINYDEIHKEVANLNVDSKPTPTLQLINLKLQKIQGSKDRLSEIYQEIVRCYTFKKRAVNILSDAWSKFADGSSQDKRKSDSSFRLSEFHADLAQIEALYNVCDHILRNLDSQSHAISRQITIIQSQLKLFDMGRGALPDFDFNQYSLNDGFDSLGDSSVGNDGLIEIDSSKDEVKNTVDPQISLPPDELSF